MPRSTEESLYSVPAKERILEAAIQRFSQHSYEDTGLRDIAADANVDVAYVHRCFGSKERLFATAVRESAGVGRVFEQDANHLIEHLARMMVHREVYSIRPETGLLDIFVRSLSSPAAASVLREYVQVDFIKPLEVRLGSPAELRAAMVGALLAGVRILRDVLEVDALRQADPHDLESILASTIAHIGTISWKRDPYAQE